jgi:ABC-type sugar transport system permease subunit
MQHFLSDTAWNALYYLLMVVYLCLSMIKLLLASYSSRDPTTHWHPQQLLDTLVFLPSALLCAIFVLQVQSIEHQLDCRMSYPS